MWKSEQYINIFFPRAKEYVGYKGFLTIINSKKKPVKLELTSSIIDSYLDALMERNISFSGNSISEVYGKMFKYFNKYGMIFVN